MEMPQLKRTRYQARVAAEKEALVRFESCHFVLSVAELFAMILGMLASDPKSLCVARLVARRWAQVGAHFITRVFFSFKNPIATRFPATFTNVRQLHVRISTYKEMRPWWKRFAAIHKNLEEISLCSHRKHPFVTFIKGREPNDNPYDEFELYVRCPVQIEDSLFGRGGNVIEIDPGDAQSCSIQNIARRRKFDVWFSRHEGFKYWADAINYIYYRPGLVVTPIVTCEYIGDGSCRDGGEYFFILCNPKEIGADITLLTDRLTPQSVVYVDGDTTDIIPADVQVRQGARALWAKMRETLELWHCRTGLG